jgi:biotin operon repressor
MNDCHGCGAALPPQNYVGRPRKWCSERCRKGSYGDPCVDCGGRTCFGAETARVPEPRCIACRQSAESGRRVKQAVEILQARRADPSRTLASIAAEIGTSRHHVRNELQRLRMIGFDFPNSTYRSAYRKVDHLSPDREALVLAREMRARGIAVPMLEVSDAA